MAALQGTIDALSRKCSRYEADLQRAQWQIDALERRLAEAPADASADTERLEAALRAAHEELARLREQRGA